MGRVALAICCACLLGACNSDSLTPLPPKPEPPPVPVTASPIAVIIQEQSAYAPLITATFDGSSSVSPNGPIVAWAWSVVARPVSSVAEVHVASSAAKAVLFLDLAGSYTVGLTVTDSAGRSGSSQVTFIAIPSDDLHVELAWPDAYGQVDLDLHLLDVSPTLGPCPASSHLGGTDCLWDPFRDCHWENCKSAVGQVLDWYVPGYTPDNPRLDIDNVATDLPENINIAQPHSSVYEIDVHYYASSHGGITIPASYSLMVYLGGQLAWTGTAQLAPSGFDPNTGYATGNLYRAALVTWSGGTGTVTPIDQTLSTSDF